MTGGSASWSEGFQWEPSTGQTAPSLWAGVDAGVGYPDIVVGGILVTDRCTGVSWTLGRTWWLAEPEPGSASIQLGGPLAGTELAALTVGDPVAISADPVGPLWRGWIDSITETTVPENGELAVGLTIVASDAMSRLLSVELYNNLGLTAGTLDRRLAELASAAGVPAPQVVRILPTAAALPVLAAVTLAGSSASPLRLGDHLAACERASNAITAVDRDGAWLVMPRARVKTTPEVVTLDDDSDPNHLRRALATPERVVNVFTIAGTTTTIAPSVAKYGRRGYDVPAGIATTPPPYAPETLTALANPLPFAAASIPIAHRTAAAVGLSPFDWCRVSTRPADEYYQALALSWSAQPDDWQLGVELDRTQMTIAAPPDPDNPDPPNPLPPTTATVTDTFACDRAAYVVKTTGGLETGNGASVDILVGLLSDGNLARGLARFSLAWRGKVVKVTSAKLRMRVGETTCSGAGSSPRVTVKRNTSSWSQGSYGTRCSFSSTNAVVYPGPNTTDDSKVTKDVSGSEGALFELNVLGIVSDWASGSPNYGVKLYGASETSSSSRARFWSNAAGTPGNRPTLVVTYEYEV
jgi:hypothetical protein